MIKAIFIIILLCGVCSTYSQSVHDPEILPNATYSDHLIYIYIATLDMDSPLIRKKLQDRLYKVVNLYDTWATSKIVGKTFSDLLFYLVIHIHEREHPHYSFYYDHCMVAHDRGEEDGEVCEVLRLLKG